MVSSSSFEPVVAIHCLAALHPRAGVESLFKFPIIQNRRAVQSTGRSMDWTLEDMVDGLFFCATPTAAEEAIPHLYKKELKRPTPVRRRLRGPTPFLGGSFEWVSDAGVGDESTESCRVVRPLCFPLVFRPLRPTPSGVFKGRRASFQNDPPPSPMSK